MNPAISDLSVILRGDACSSVISSDGEESSAKETKDVYIPITKRTVAYIVAAVIFNEKGEVLMMQEAKISCYGHWYLPAGRLEPDESIEEGSIREVLEETGLLYEPSTLLCIEAYKGPWYRFTFTGKVTGGTLKSLEHKDEESLQAMWFSVEEIKKGTLKIRCNDILKVINTAVDYRSATHKHADLRSIVHPHSHVLLRLVIVHIPVNSKPIKLLTVRRKDKLQLPTIVQTDRSGYTLSMIVKELQNVFGSISSDFVLSVLSVEHSGKPAGAHDGLCLTILVSLQSAPDILGSSVQMYQWLNLEDSKITSDISNRLQSVTNSVRLVSD